MIEKGATPKAYTLISNTRLKDIVQETEGSSAQDRAFLGQSTSIKKLFLHIDALSLGTHPILISGESGTGKKLIGRALHRKNHENAGRFFIIEAKDFPGSDGWGLRNCGLHLKNSNMHYSTDDAKGGTVLIADVGDLSLAAQTALLEHLQLSVFTQAHGFTHAPSDVRIIATTKTNLEVQVRKGLFREDLFQLLSTCFFVVPPLRERQEDIVLLARYCMHKVAMRSKNQVSDISAAALLALQAHDWPGNVRELQNVVERAMVLCHGHRIEHADLSFILPQSKKSQSCRPKFPMLYGKARARKF